MRLPLQKVPIQALVVIPLSPLAKFATHEQQLLAGVSVHVAIKQAQIAEFVFQIKSRHFAEQRSLSVHDLVMGKGQDKIFSEGVDQSKGQVVVMKFAMDGIFGKVDQDIIHPAHVPFQAESQPAEVDRTRNGRPGGGFFCNGQHARMIMMSQLIKFLDEVNSL